MDHTISSPQKTALFHGGERDAFEILDHSLRLVDILNQNPNQFESVRKALPLAGRFLALSWEEQQTVRKRHEFTRKQRASTTYSGDAASLVANQADISPIESLLRSTYSVSARSVPTPKSVTSPAPSLGQSLQPAPKPIRSRNRKALQPKQRQRSANKSLLSNISASIDTTSTSDAPSSDMLVGEKSMLSPDADKNQSANLPDISSLRSHHNPVETHVIQGVLPVEMVVHDAAMSAMDVDFSLEDFSFTLPLRSTSSPRHTEDRNLHEVVEVAESRVYTAPAYHANSFKGTNRVPAEVYGFISNLRHPPTQAFHSDGRLMREWLRKWTPKLIAPKNLVIKIGSPLHEYVSMLQQKGQGPEQAGLSDAYWAWLTHKDYVGPPPDRSWFLKL